MIVTGIAVSDALPGASVGRAVWVATIAFDGGGGGGIGIGASAAPETGSGGGGGVIGITT